MFKNLNIIYNLLKIMFKNLNHIYNLLKSSNLSHNRKNKFQRLQKQRSQKQLKIK